MFFVLSHTAPPPHLLNPLPPSAAARGGRARGPARVKKSHWISVQREVGLALEQGPHRGKGLNLITLLNFTSERGTFAPH
jgi:hypothetical protein